MLAAGIALTVLGVPVGLGRYASLGHAAGPRSFTVRSGWVVREQAVLQRRAVVGWRVRQSFFQRMMGTGYIGISTAKEAKPTRAMRMIIAQARLTPRRRLVTFSCLVMVRVPRVAFGNHTMPRLDSVGV